MLISLALHCYLCNLRNLRIALGVPGGLAVQISIQPPKTTPPDFRARLRAAIIANAFVAQFNLRQLNKQK
jgi:hypothetical protein